MMTFKQRRPSIACEFTSTHVVAGHVADGMIDMSSTRVLRHGALAPALTGTNFADRDLVRRALRETVAALGSHEQEISAVLPDACCRVVLIDLDVLPEKRAEAEVLIRHRLKKSLPFDVEEARVSWQGQRINGKTNVLAAVTHKSVLQEYESVAREAGCNPGLVLPSILASLRLVDGSEPTLLIKIDALTSSIAIANDGVVLLIRVLDRTPGQRSEGAKLADDVHASLVFFQDTYGTSVQRILISSIVPCDELISALQESTGVRPQELLSAEHFDGACGNERSVLGAIAGALL